jgi:hypothetical protein
METILTYRKRSVTKQDIVAVRRIIKSHPDKSRRFISQEVCRKWDWRQPNGVLKDMVCRSILLLLESKSLIKLPARKKTKAFKQKKTGQKYDQAVKFKKYPSRNCGSFLTQFILIRWGFIFI